MYFTEKFVLHTVNNLLYVSQSINQSISIFTVPLAIKTTARSTKVLTKERSLDQKILSWCRKKSMDDAEMTLSGGAVQNLAAAIGKTLIA